ncbi:GrpB family protein [Desulfitibacter alkalitolerans]|uniref:GrpB family protein n=1 Tax=Desulfitibacter alkalitolerans TaxID=264641 RepID=UPI0006876829|nr:GrpB family protein [Desulfitibacter alkalitolerans]
MGLSYDVVKLVAYRKEWAEKFIYEAELIADLTGIEKAKIRHIGSTSVPGMIAKPILDIMIEVNKIDDIIKFIPSLDEIGYRFFGECGRPGRMFFVKGKPSNCTHHLHVMEKGSIYWKNNIRFKELLINKPDLAVSYAKVKRNLASKYPYNREEYRINKSKFIEKILNTYHEDTIHDRPLW